MKYLIIMTALLLTFFAIPCFLPSQDAYDQAIKAGFDNETIERGRQYAFERQLFFWPWTILHLALLLFLVANSRRLADRCGQLVRGWWLPNVLLVGLVCVVLEEAINLPFGLARLEHSREWGLTKRSTEDWLQQHFLGFAVFGAIEALVLVGFYLFVRFLPRTWWLACSFVVPLLAIGGTILHPLFLAPLFNTFEPLDQSQWKHLKPEVEQILKKAGVDVAEVLVVDASRQGEHTNAYFTGFGSSRRIVLYDTLLKNQTPAEVESILAHELGHWLHDHINKGIMLGAVAAYLGFFLLFVFLKWMIGRPPCYLKSAADPAGLPLLILIYVLAGWVTMPAQNVFSRYIERQADEESLNLARQPRAFIDAERKLAEKNVSRLDAHPFMVILYYSHPPAAERIQMAKDWEKAHKIIIN
jgi:STE24 endopeptidase